MATTTAQPNGDAFVSGWVNESSSGTNVYLSVDEGVNTNDSDTTYMAGIDGDIAQFNLTNMPSNFSVATGVTVRIRARNTNSKGDAASLSQVKLLKSDLITALTSTGGGITLTTSYVTYEQTLTITGSTDKTSWDGAVLNIQANGTNGLARVTAIEVLITYTATAGGGGATTSKVHKILLGDK